MCRRNLGLPQPIWSEQKLAAPSGERLPECAWFRHFRLARGAEIKEDDLTQNGKSATSLQKTAHVLRGKGSKHVQARLRIAVDKITNKELRTACCPAAEMIADHNSKPLQGQGAIVYKT